ncbi:formate/nitrite transporter family protein [Spiroplasma endosymbiont of Atherix ibis]|uniref:formate/nitrite transporter family protein n=1 Tax=Spiroplasma endosymbiont of Atherix ibis TaxID=3066291 RepID=UPI0030D5BADE
MNKNINIEEEIRSLKEVDYGILDAQHSFMVDGVLGGFKAAMHKLHYTFIKQILLGIMSGVIIGFGYVACIIAMVSLKGTGFEAFGTILLGFIFPGCIIMITFLGGGLFTSHVFSTIPIFKGCGSKRLYLKGIFGVLLGNLVGTFIFVAIFSGAGGLWNNGPFLNKVFAMSMHKLYLVNYDLQNNESIKAVSILATIGIGICSGILCNIMVCSTLPLASTTKNAAAIILLMIFPIAYFAIGSFQHGPANSFFMWMLLFEIIFNHSQVAITSGSGEILLRPQFYHFVLFIGLSTIPTLIGNWIGGALLLSGVLYFINKEYVSILFKKIKLEYLEEKMRSFKEIADKQIKKNDKKLKQKANIQVRKNDKNSE